MGRCTLASRRSDHNLLFTSNFLLPIIIQGESRRLVQAVQLLPAPLPADTQTEQRSEYPPISKLGSSPPLSGVNYIGRTLVRAVSGVSVHNLPAPVVALTLIANM